MTTPWSDLPFLLAVARSGTLSSAARTLKLDRTTVSRRIERLERTLGCKLFDRTDGDFVLSPTGRKVFAAAESAEQELSALQSLRLGDQPARARLRVSMSEHLLITLANCFKDFALENPGILLELTATDRTVDLQHFEADVVLRITRGSLARLDSRNIGKPIFSLYKMAGDAPLNPRYLSRPSEKSVPKYLRAYLPDAQIIASLDGLVSMREMIAIGTGYGILPNYFGDKDSRIERCSGPLPSIGYSLFIAFSPEQRRLSRLKIFVDFVELHLRNLQGFERSAAL